MLPCPVRFVGTDDFYQAGLASLAELVPRDIA